MRIDQKSWTIDLWSGHERDMSETCNGFYNISSPCLGIEAYLEDTKNVFH